MRRTLDLIYIAAAWLAAAAVFAIFVLMVGQSVLREVGVRTGGVNDIVGWLTAAAAFLAMPHSFRHGDFVRVTLSLENAPPRLRRGLEIGSLAIAALFVGYLAWWAVLYTYQSWEFKEMPTGQVALPLWIPQLSFAVGAVLLFIAVLDEFFVTVRGGTPSYVRAVEERHARGDYSEDM
jgi:TRAP-type C4-dicarboxylate transport system permease small subunit